MANRRAKRTEKFRSEASKADITVGNIQIRQTGGIVMTQRNELTREEAFHIYQLKCHFKQAFHSGAFITVTYATEPIHYQISEYDFSFFWLLFAAFISSMESREMLSYLVC